MFVRLRQRFNSRLRYKIIVPYLLLAALLLILLGILVFYTIATRLQQQLDRALAESVVSTSLEWETLEDQTLDQMFVVVGAPADPSRALSSTVDAFAARDTAQIEKILRTAMDFYLPGGILALDQTGKVLVDVTQPEVRQQVPTLVGTTALQEIPNVQAILTGKQDLIGDKYAGLLQIAPNTDYTLFYIVVPVKQIAADGSEQVLGAVMFTEPLEWIIQERLVPRNRSTITAVLNAAGTVLASNLPSENQSFALSPEQISQLGGQNSALTNQISLETLSLQTLYNPLRIRRNNLGFVAVMLPRSAISETWAESRQLVLLIALGAFLGVVVIGLLITRRITSPLNELVATALAVKQGNLEQRSTVQQNDEVGTLATVLNDMTDRLFDLYRTSRSMARELTIEGVIQQTDLAIKGLIPASQVQVVLFANQQWHCYSEGALTAQPALYSPDVIDRLPAIYELATTQASLVRFQTLAPEAWVLLPLRPQQQSIGLVIVSADPASVSLGSTSEPLSAIASMAATALQNAVLYAAVQYDARRQQAILQSIADGVLVLDKAQRITIANQSATEMMQLPMAELLSQSFGHLPLNPVPTTAEMFATKATTAPTVYAYGERIFSLSTAPIKGTDEDDEGEVVILHDLTAQQVINQAKTDFIATISHELRTPLTSMCGYTDLLLTGLLGEVNDKQRESLHTIRNQGQVMVEVLKNVILIASIDAGSTTPELQPHSVSDVLESGLSNERHAITQKGLELHIKVPEDLPLVLIDAYHLKIALQQVFNNARRYTETGSIKIRALRDGDMVRIDVLDTGTGISLDDQKRLFMRFQRGGEQSGLTAVERGTGLGLSITRHLLEQIGGRIRVRSKVGVGSCFSLWVPAVAIVESDEPETEVAYATSAN